MTDAPSQRHKSKMKTLIRKLNNDISNMELTTGEMAAGTNPYREDLSKRNWKDKNLTREQNLKRIPESWSNFNDAKVMARRVIRMLRGKPLASALGKKRAKLQDHLKKMEQLKVHRGR
jgi:hypothetical protein|tara:strand:- start:973 stop:1326 length:354 start_codon:yes stop_codon:yes gene_type:complete